MSIERSIGKNTIGDGKKMKVHMGTYDRSTNDMSYAWRSPMTVGTLVPFICEYVQKGDTWEFDIDALTLTHPTTGPLYGSFKQQGDIFVCPIRLYQGWLHNNKLGVGMDMSRIKLPVTEVTVKIMDNPKADDQFTQINPSCLLSYFGRKGWAYVARNETIQKQCIPLIGYWDIYKNFYANKQEANGYYIARRDEISEIVVYATNGTTVLRTITSNFERVRVAAVADQQILVKNVNAGQNVVVRWQADGSPVESRTLESFAVNKVVEATGVRYVLGPNVTGNFLGFRSGTGLVVDTFPLENIDKMREDILYWNQEAAFKITETTYAPYGKFCQRQSGTNTKLNTVMPQFGLGLKTYQSDIFNNWINSAWIDQITNASSVAVVGGKITMDAMNMAKKIYDMMNRVAISGGTYEDWLETMFPGNYFQKTETPEYIGGFSREIEFQQNISQAAAEGEPLGTIGGVGRTTKPKGGKVRVRIDEPSYIIGLVSLTPRVDYSQGNHYDTNILTLDQFHKPALDGIGFQDLTADKMFWGEERYNSSGIKSIRAVGKQPAWIDYKTNYNKTFGNFAARENEAFMVLNRDYMIGPSNQLIGDLTTYIDPVKYNYIFASKALDETNFWVQIGVGAECRRLITASMMPNL